MRYRTGKSMGLWMLPIAGLFLFHPTVAFVDVLPDCIGYLLICAGLSRLADLNGHIYESFRRFRMLLLIGVGQLFATYMIYGFMSGQASEMNPYEQPVTVLLCSFVVLFLQWYFLIPALRDLFAGLDDLALRYDGQLLTGEKRRKTPSERMNKLSAFFVIVSSLMSVLPELSILTSFENDAGNPIFPFDWYNFILFFRVIGAVLALIVGVVWLVSFWKYFRLVLKDRVWLLRLEETYIAEILPQTGMLTVRRFSWSFLLINIGMVFTVSLRLSDRTALPGVVCAALVWMGLFLLKEPLPQRRSCYAACGALAVCSVSQIVANVTYLRKYLPEASLYDPDAFWHYTAVRVLDGLEAILTLIVVGTLLQMLFSVVQAHTSVEYGTPGSEEISQRATARLHREFSTRSSIIFVIFCFAAAINVADAVFRFDYQWLWLVSFVVTFAGIWLFSSMLYDLRQQICVRYQSDGMNKSI